VHNASRNAEDSRAAHAQRIKAACGQSGEGIVLTQISLDEADRRHPEYARFLQSPFWARFKQAQGWTPLFFRIISAPPSMTVYDGEQFAVLTRRVSRWSLAYIPLYPEIPQPGERAASASGTGAFLTALCAALRSFLPRGTLCVRFDLTPAFETSAECASWKKALCETPGVRNGAPVQPPDTVVLDLAPSEERLLSRMKSKWRYNIRLAEKKGVTVRRGTADEIAVFYNLYAVTARRDGIAIHSRAYYQSLFERAAERGGVRKNPDVRLYLAEHGGDALAAIVALFCPREGAYLYGAASNSKRNFMAAYLLQWQAIRDAKEYGCRCYDLYGIPPDDDACHPMHGLYRFKTGFGGTIIHRPGCADVPLSPAYPLYRAAEALRAFWHKRIKKLRTR
jgi:lipid II:glycine glycyltransferase (peptidoglycan interpeptide bridge formation enzyme)